jgi:cation transport ATPase
MEYKISNRLKIGAIICVVLGLLGVAYGFYESHQYKTVEDVKVLLANEDGHGGEHVGEAHGTGHSEEASHDTMTHANADHAEEAHAEGHEMSHEEHVLHQIHNRPYAALYVAAFFFFMIALGVLAFYAIQYAAQAGWSPVLFRVMEAITAYVLPGALIVLAIALFAGKHLFVWMDPEVVAHDKLIQGKSGFLNKGVFIGLSLFFIFGWSAYRYLVRKFSLAQDSSDNNSYFKKAFRWSAGFLVFYIVTESIVSWLWVMSVDPHWFSTLFGWYVFASMFVSGITVIAMITIYLKSKGLLEFVNDSHIHDLGKVYVWY